MIDKDWVIQNPEKAAKTIEQLRVIEQHRDILAMHMAEVKAISDGSTKNTLNDVVEHCLKEIRDMRMTDGTHEIETRVEEGQSDLTDFVVRCDIVTKCLPKSKFKNEFGNLLTEMLAEIEKLKRHALFSNQIIHNMVTANQAAWIEGMNGRGPEYAVQWIENGLCGRGQIPENVDNKTAQQWFDENTIICDAYTKK